MKTGLGTVQFSYMHYKPEWLIESTGRFLHAKTQKTITQMQESHMALKKTIAQDSFCNLKKKLQNVNSISAFVCVFPEWTVQYGWACILACVTV